jgi:sulfate permease, SulP family
MHNTSLPLPVSLTGLFADKEKLTIFMEYLREVKLNPEQCLFRKGDAPNGVYFVLSGQVSSILELPNGQIKRLQTFGIGEIVGEGECYCNVPRLVSLVANQTSYLYHLSNYAWERLERKSPAIATEFHQYLLGRLALRFNLDKLLVNSNQPAGQELKY